MTLKRCRGKRGDVVVELVSPTAATARWTRQVLAEHRRAVRALRARTREAAVADDLQRDALAGSWTFPRPGFQRSVKSECVWGCHEPRRDDSGRARRSPGARDARSGAGARSTRLRRPLPLTSASLPAPPCRRSRGPAYQQVVSTEAWRHGRLRGQPFEGDDYPRIERGGPNVSCLPSCDTSCPGAAPRRRHRRTRWGTRALMCRRIQQPSRG